MHTSNQKPSVDKSLKEYKLIDNITIFYKLSNKKKKFEQIYYKLNNSLDKEILNIIDDCFKYLQDSSILESYEHLFIKIENKKRNFLNYQYDGIIFFENLSQPLKIFYLQMRTFLKEFVNEDIGKKINYQSQKVSDEWFFLNIEKKNETIKTELQKFREEFYKDIEINFLELKNTSEVYINIPGEKNLQFKPQITFNFEIYIKQKIDQNLTVYFKTAIDKNKGRRL